MRAGLPDSALPHCRRAYSAPAAHPATAAGQQQLSRLGSPATRPHGPSLRGHTQPPAGGLHHNTAAPASQQQQARQQRRPPLKPAAAAGSPSSAGPGHPQPPDLPQQVPSHEETWHGTVRVDEYHWLTQLPPTHPQVLSHLKAENAHAISCLAHTRQLQLQLQAALNAWTLAAALSSTTQDDAAKGDDDQQQQAQQPVVVPADWAGGTGSLRYRQYSSFGWPGVQQCGWRYLSVPAAAAAAAAAGSGSREGGGFLAAAPQEGPAVGAAPLLHYRAPVAPPCSSGAEQQDSANAAGLGLPHGAVLLWSEAADAADTTSSSSRLRAVRSNAVHSVAVSPDGCLLAVTHKPHSQASSYSLSLVDCSTGREVLQPIHGVDGPVQWVQRPPAPAAAAAAAAAVQTHKEQQQQQQYLLYVAGDSMQVHCCKVPGPLDSPAVGGQGIVAAAAAVAAVGAAAAVLPPAWTHLVFSDPQHVSVSLAVAGGLALIQVHAADGLPRQVLYHNSSSSSSPPPTDACAWHNLITPSIAVTSSSSFCVDSSSGKVAAAAEAEEEEDPSVRVVVSQAGGWLLLRHSCAAAPQGQLFVAKLPAADAAGAHTPQQQQEQEQQLHWLHVPLPSQPGLLLEAAMAYHHHQQQQQADHRGRMDSSSSGGGSSSTGTVTLHLLLLWCGWESGGTLLSSHIPTTQQEQQQQQQPAGSVSLQPCRQSLQADLYCLNIDQPGQQQHKAGLATTHSSSSSVGSSAGSPPATTQGQQQQQQQHQQQQQRQLELHHIAACPVVLPDAFADLQGVSWSPSSCQLSVTFSSLTRPLSKLTVNLPAHGSASDQHPQPQQQQQQRQELEQLQASVPGFDPSAYSTAQLAVPASDGSLVPLSLAWSTHQHTQQPLVGWQALQQQQTGRSLGTDMVSATNSTDTNSSGSSSTAFNPMLLTCYGSYGIRESVGFSPELLQLLDAGWVVGVAHVRGGGWLGRAWADAGRGLGKPRSIQDLLDVAHYVQQVGGMCAPGALCVSGTSAGGWLAASAALQAPHLFRSLVLTVPCLDPLGLMLQQRQGRVELGDAANSPRVFHVTRDWAPYDLLEALLLRPARDSTAQTTDNSQPQPLLTHQHQQQQHQPTQQQQQRSHLPDILIQAALSDPEVPLHVPVRTTARLRRWALSQQQKRQQQQQTLAESNACKGVSVSGSGVVPGGGAVLLRVVPGGHTALVGEVREAAVKLAFLLESVVVGGGGAGGVPDKAQ